MTLYLPRLYHGVGSQLTTVRTQPTASWLNDALQAKGAIPSRDRALGREFTARQRMKDQCLQSAHVPIRSCNKWLQIDL